MNKVVDKIKKKSLLSQFYIYATTCTSIFQLGKLTVAVLKEFVKKADLKPDSQKKADLIDAISDHFGVD